MNLLYIELSAYNSGTVKILLVEDDPDILTVVKAGLEADYHTVETAVNGGDGSFMARNYDYDAIILDYSLPKKKGIILWKIFLS